ncbi:MAG: substrate-binding domain-containing protein [Pseudomonadota bacterium]
MATLKDIGIALGLSPATVSRALNGFPEVNAETRAKVKETADRLGYRPNRAAQRLVTGKSGLVGMILDIQPDMSADQTFFEILTGLTAALANRDADLVLTVDQFDDPTTPYTRMIDRNLVDGFILNAPMPGDERIALLQELEIPFVVHGRSDPAADYPYYDIDNHAVPRDSVDLLTALGHRRIALLNGEAHFAFAAERDIGFQDAMSTYELPVPEAFVAHGALTENYGYTVALPMLAGRLGPRPTAVICASTLIAAGVLRAAQDMDLRVPEDISVIAHDDALPHTRARHFNPALTVTRAALRDACKPLANHLLDRISGAPVSDLQTLVRAELIVRGSTGPAPLTEKDPWP